MSGFFFDPIKKDRGWYFVKYHPVSPSLSFAALNLVVTGEVSIDTVAEAMERELREWLPRYPVPTMVSSFDIEDGLIGIASVRDCDHLFGFVDVSGEPHFEWRLLSNAELERFASTEADIRAVYHDVPYRTQENVEKAADKMRRKRRFAWLLVVLWIAIVPALIAVAGVASPAVGIATMIYAVGMGIRRTLKMLGKWPKSASERAKEREDLLMRHHHYHCMRNPSGFEKLKLENFAEDQRQQIKQEQDEIRRDEKHGEAG